MKISKMNSIFRHIAWYIADIPKIYELIQKIAGIKFVHKNLRAHIEISDKEISVLDVGGGTGISRALWPKECNYICIDLDRRKLSHFLGKYPGSKILLADVSSIPIADNSMDAVVCISIAHHLSDSQLYQMVNESSRVLKEGGKLFFVDPIWSPNRIIGRLLWIYDQGEYPRKAEGLYHIIADQYNILHWKKFKTLHESVLCVAQKRKS